MYLEKTYVICCNQPYFSTRGDLCYQRVKKKTRIVLVHAICVCSHKVATCRELCHIVHWSSLILSAVFLLIFVLQCLWLYNLLYIVD